MSIEILKTQLAVDMARLNSTTVSAVVIWHDAQGKNAWVAARECGTYEGRAYDKFRVRAWYFKSRDGIWCRGNDTLACQWADRDAAIDAFAGIECGNDTVTYSPVEVTA